jgi:phosphoglycolate phosphatase
MPWLRDVFNDVAEKFGFARLAEAEMELLRSEGAREIMRRLGVPAWKLPIIARHVRALKARDAHQVELFPGVGDLLQRLAAGGITLAIVSSDNEANVRRTLGERHAARIHHYACAAPVFGKHVRMRRVVRRSGISPTETLAIGDELRDLEAARRAGIPFAGVAWGYARPEVLLERAPATVFRSIEEIAAWFRS